MGKRPAVAKRLRWGKSRGSQAAEVDTPSHFEVCVHFCTAIVFLQRYDLGWVSVGVGKDMLNLKNSEVLVCLFSGKTKINENKLMILSKSPNFVNGTWKEPWLGAPFHVSFRNLITTHAS